MSLANTKCRSTCRYIIQVDIQRTELTLCSSFVIVVYLAKELHYGLTKPIFTIQHGTLKCIRKLGVNLVSHSTNFPFKFIMGTDLR